MEKLILKNSPFKTYTMSIISTYLESNKVIVDIAVIREKKMIVLRNIIMDIEDNNHVKLSKEMTKDDLEKLYEIEWKKLYPELFQTDSEREKQLNSERKAFDRIFPEWINLETDLDGMFDVPSVENFQTIIINSIEKGDLLWLFKTEEIKVERDDWDEFYFTVQVTQEWDESAEVIVEASDNDLDDKELSIIEWFIEDFFVKWQEESYTVREDSSHNWNSYDWTYKIEIQDTPWKKTVREFKVNTTNWTLYYEVAIESDNYIVLTLKEDQSDFKPNETLEQEIETKIQMWDY